MGRRERSEYLQYLQYLGISSGISTGGYLLGGQMAGRWSSVYTLAVELLRPGGNSRGKHSTHQPPLHRYRDICILSFLIDTIELWIDMFNLSI